MFIETGYVVLRNAVELLLCRYITEEFNVMLANGHLATDDKQVERAYFAYGLPATEALLTMVMPTVERETGIELLPTYSYARIYLPGASLKKHTDRAECEVSTTVTLAQRTEKPWPIYLESRDRRTIEVTLAPGDMLIYAGTEMPHWREPSDDQWQLQVFLHYVRKHGPFADRKYDSRPRLGAPQFVAGTQEARAKA